MVLHSFQIGNHKNLTILLNLNSTYTNFMKKLNKKYADLLHKAAIATGRKEVVGLLHKAAKLQTKFDEKINF